METVFCLKAETPRLPVSCITLHSSAALISLFQNYLNGDFPPRPFGKLAKFKNLMFYFEYQKQLAVNNLAVTT